MSGDRGSEQSGKQSTPSASESVSSNTAEPATTQRSSEPHELAPSVSSEGASLCPSRTDTKRVQSPRTLEQRLGTDDFARRGWQRLIELTDYFAHLVDGRTTGVLATESRAVYLRVLFLATTLKAAAQWFTLDENPRPKFVVEAERYLAEGERGARIAAPTMIPEEELPPIMSGPVVARKGGRGTAGRLRVLAEIKRELVGLLSPLAQTDLQERLRVLRNPEDGDSAEAWRLVAALGDSIVFPLMYGACADLLREQGFIWPPWDLAQLRVFRSIITALNESTLAPEPGKTRESRLNDVAERLIRAVLSALGVRADKDLFRERRDR